MWYIIASIPVILITSIFLGFEAPFYYAISLIGFSFWKFGTDDKVKKIGVIICAIGTVLFYITFVYYLTAGILLSEEPFKFRIFGLVYSLLTGGP
jgi:hypothetical protein